MKPVTMELGGHAPAIVFEDADLERAAKVLAAAKYRNAGQVCISPTRFLIAEPAYDAFMDAYVAETRARVVGPGAREGVDMGPLANDRRRDAVEALVQEAVSAGATLLHGGGRIGNEGYFLEPAVLGDVPVEAEAMNVEPFGPVTLASRFGSADEAIAESNRLPYGLAAYAFAEDRRTIARVSREVEAGMVSINHFGLGLAELPFGGVRDFRSRLGGRTRDGRRVPAHQDRHGRLTPSGPARVGPRAGSRYGAAGGEGRLIHDVCERGPDHPPCPLVVCKI